MPDDDPDREHDTKRQFAEAVLAPAKIDGYGGRLFTIGPFGMRVGFAFQQNRALNLVYALHATKGISRDDRIAVIGGGISGITARLALRGLNYIDVDLYEKQQDIVTLQRYASHRTVHPNYNDWPIANRFAATTNLPFLNWYADNANLVVGTLRNAWHREYAKCLTKPIMQREITGIATEKDIKSRITGLVITTRATDTAGPLVTQRYDYVIAATGFGEEQDLAFSCCGGYWDRDDIDKLRDTGKEATVTAIGDGGLIDCIRLCCSDQNEAHMMAIELIYRLRHANYRKAATGDDATFVRSDEERRIADLENEAAKLIPGTPEASEQFGTATENEIARFLGEGYADILRLLPRSATDLLDERITGLEKITLVGRLETPFSCATAPINKLIMAYLLARRPDLYVRGVVEWETDTDGRKTKITIVRKDGGDPAGLLAGKVVLRLGGQPPIYEFAAGFKEANRSLHRALKEWSAMGRSDDEICAGIGDVANCEAGTRGFLNKRFHLADAFAKRHLSFEVSPGGRPGTGTHFTFDSAQMNNELHISTVARRLGGFPHELFGVPLLPENPATISSALARPR